ncbi:Cupredoxin [Mycena rosella]|uniref:Cupredoxin n=1 Tax=Mycena rosella TaxID=1033263 RepID=A0AAD7MBS2_MYCRO|nr:Cupredoxin [Mycena rosella]
MRFSLAVAALAPVLSVYADNILVQVGAGGQLAFSPQNITAKIGDVVTFQFQGKNHSVTQSTFANPCTIQTAPAQGIDSGFQFVSPNATQLPEWTFTMDNETTPLWFFCPASHCQAGMVFSINANEASAKSFEVYQAAAKASGNAVAAGGAAASSVGSALGSDIGAATSALGSDIGAATSALGGVAGEATSVIAGGVGAATSAIAGAAGAAATDAANALTGLAAGLTGGANPTGSTNTTGAGFRLSSNTASLFAVVGLTAMLL